MQTGMSGNCRCIFGTQCECEISRKCAGSIADSGVVVLRLFEEKVPERCNERNRTLPCRVSGCASYHVFGAFVSLWTGRIRRDDFRCVWYDGKCLRLYFRRDDTVYSGRLFPRFQMDALYDSLYFAGYSIYGDLEG